MRLIAGLVAVTLASNAAAQTSLVEVVQTIPMRDEDIALSRTLSGKNVRVDGDVMAISDNAKIHMYRWNGSDFNYEADAYVDSGLFIDVKNETLFYSSYAAAIAIQRQTPANTWSFNDNNAVSTSSTGEFIVRASSSGRRAISAYNPIGKVVFSEKESSATWYNRDISLNGVGGSVGISADGSTGVMCGVSFCSAAQVISGSTLRTGVIQTYPRIAPGSSSTSLSNTIEVNHDGSVVFITQASTGIVQVYHRDFTRKQFLLVQNVTEPGSRPGFDNKFGNRMTMVGNDRVLISSFFRAADGCGEVYSFKLNSQNLLVHEGRIGPETCDIMDKISDIHSDGNHIVIGSYGTGTVPARGQAIRYSVDFPTFDADAFDPQPTALAEVRGDMHMQTQDASTVPGIRGYFHAVQNGELLAVANFYSVDIYKWNDTVDEWFIDLDYRIVPPAAQAVRVSFVGTTLVVSVTSNQIYIYELDVETKTWTSPVTLTHPLGRVGGYADSEAVLRPDGNVLFVGCPSCSTQMSTLTGDVSVYVRDGNDWVFHQILDGYEMELVDNTRFGSFLSASNTHLVADGYGFIVDSNNFYTRYTLPGTSGVQLYSRGAVSENHLVVLNTTTSVNGFPRSFSLFTHDPTTGTWGSYVNLTVSPQVPAVAFNSLNHIRFCGGQQNRIAALYHVSRNGISGIPQIIVFDRDETGQWTAGRFYNPPYGVPVTDYNGETRIECDEDRIIMVTPRTSFRTYGTIYTINEPSPTAFVENVPAPTPFPTTGTPTGTYSPSASPTARTEVLRVQAVFPPDYTGMYGYGNSFSIDGESLYVTTVNMSQVYVHEWSGFSWSHTPSQIITLPVGGVGQNVAVKNDVMVVCTQTIVATTTYSGIYYSIKTGDTWGAFVRVSGTGNSVNTFCGSNSLRTTGTIITVSDAGTVGKLVSYKRSGNSFAYVNQHNYEYSSSASGMYAASYSLTDNVLAIAEPATPAKVHILERASTDVLYSRIKVQPFTQTITGVSVDGTSIAVAYATTYLNNYRIGLIEKLGNGSWTSPIEIRAEPTGTTLYSVAMCDGRISYGLSRGTPFPQYFIRIIDQSLEDPSVWIPSQEFEADFELVNAIQCDGLFSMASSKHYRVDYRGHGAVYSLYNPPITRAPTLSPTMSPTPTPKALITTKRNVVVDDPVKRKSAASTLAAAGSASLPSAVVRVRANEVAAIDLNGLQADSTFLDAVRTSICGVEVDDDLMTCNVRIAPTSARRMLQIGNYSVNVIVTFDVSPAGYAALAEWSTGGNFSAQLAAILGVPIESVTLTGASGTVEVAFTLVQNTTRFDPYGDLMLSDLEAVQAALETAADEIVIELGLNEGDIQTVATDLCDGRDCNGRGTCNAETGKCACVGNWLGGNCEIECSCVNGGQCNGSGYCKCPYPYSGIRCEETTECAACT